MPIRILIVDDQLSMLDKLERQLDNVPGVTVVGRALSGRESIDLVRSINPDFVIMDVEMPGLNGIETAQLILTEFPKTIILAISMHTDRWTVRAMLDVGARGYITKDTNTAELGHALKVILEDKLYLSEDLKSAVG